MNSGEWIRAAEAFETFFDTFAFSDERSVNERFFHAAGDLFINGIDFFPEEYQGQLTQIRLKLYRPFLNGGMGIRQSIGRLNEKEIAAVLETLRRIQVDIVERLQEIEAGDYRSFSDHSLAAAAV